MRSYQPSISESLGLILMHMLIVGTSLSSVKSELSFLGAFKNEKFCSRFKPQIWAPTMSITKRVQQWTTFARVWHVYDATWQNPFESANLLKKYLQGLHKPIYHPMNDCGDHVVVINTKDIALPGKEWQKRVYFHHTGYPKGGATWTMAWELHDKDPTMVLKKAIYHSMKGNLQRRYTMERLHLFADDKIPKDILDNISSQIRQIRPVPQRLDKIPLEDVEKFPKIMNWPSDYILR